MTESLRARPANIRVINRRPTPSAAPSRAKKIAEIPFDTVVPYQCRVSQIVVRVVKRGAKSCGSCAMTCPFAIITLVTPVYET